MTNGGQFFGDFFFVFWRCLIAQVFQFLLMYPKRTWNNEHYISPFEVRTWSSFGWVKFRVFTANEIATWGNPTILVLYNTGRVSFSGSFRECSRLKFKLGIKIKKSNEIATWGNLTILTLYITGRVSSFGDFFFGDGGSSLNSGLNSGFKLQFY